MSGCRKLDRVESRRPSIAYYVTAHGFGHVTRACDILAALLRAAPEATLHVVTEVPEAYLRARLPHAHARMHVRSARFDAGMVQIDALRVDLEKSLARAERIVADAERLVAAEVTFLRALGVDAVVADIPAIPLVAARRVGIPALGVANFGWDFIYEPFAKDDPRWSPVVSHFREGYGVADRILRLPFSEAMTAFPRRTDIPLVATPGESRRAELAARYGLREDRTWVLISILSVEWDAEAVARVEAIGDVELLTLPPLRVASEKVRVLDREHVSFTDLLASCDVVLGKTGFGLLSECAVNDKPLAWVGRESFREEGILVEALRRSFRQCAITSEAFRRGDVEAGIRGALACPRPTSAPLGRGGDDEAARIILDYAAGRAHDEASV